MLRTTVDMDKYKFTYTYDKFTIYSNNESSTLVLETMPIYTNDYDDSVIRGLLNSDILKFICNNQKVLAIVLVGSRSIEVIDQWSDYDLLVITDDNDVYRNNKLDYYIVYDNKVSIHYSQYSKNLLFKPKRILDWSIFWQLPQEKYIAVWDLNFVEQLKKSVNEKAAAGCIDFYNNVYKSTINQVLEGNELPQTKLLYHLCVVSHFLDKTELNYKLLNELKRIKYIEVSEECRSYCIERIQLVKNIAEEESK